MSSHPEFFSGKQATFNPKALRTASVDKYIISDYSGNLDVVFYEPSVGN